VADSCLLRVLLDHELRVGPQREARVVHHRELRHAVGAGGDAVARIHRGAARGRGRRRAGLVSVTAPVTKVNSPAAAPPRGQAQRRGQGRALQGRSSDRFMGALRFSHVATDRRRDLVAVEVVDVDVGAVVGEDVEQPQRALLAEVPREPELTSP
jgi:hypothetical protein